MQHWVIPEKIHTSTTEGMVENLMAEGRGGGGVLGIGGVMVLEIQMGGGL